MMGFILDLPTTAAPFGAETRRESFYIGTDTENRVIEAKRVDRLLGSFSVLVEHVPALRAALEAVRVAARYDDWSQSARIEDIGPSAAAVPWTITRQDDRLIISGRVVAYGSDGGWVLTDSIELCYRDLDGLVHLLTTSI